MDQSSLSLNLLKKSQGKMGEGQSSMCPSSLNLLKKSKTEEAQSSICPSSLNLLKKFKTEEHQDFVFPASLKLFKKRRGKTKEKTLFLKRKRLDKKKAARGLYRFSLQFSDIVLPYQARQNSRINGNPARALSVNRIKEQSSHVNQKGPAKEEEINHYIRDSYVRICQKGPAKEEEINRIKEQNSRAGGKTLHRFKLSFEDKQNSHASGKTEEKPKNSNRAGIKEKCRPLSVKKQQMFLYSSCFENAAFTKRERSKNSKRSGIYRFDGESSAIFQSSPGEPHSLALREPEKGPKTSNRIDIKSKKGQLLIETLFVIISLLAFLSAVQFFQSLARKEIQKQRVTKENFHKGKILTAPWHK